MYVLPFPPHSLRLVNTAATQKHYHDNMFHILGSTRCAVYLLHGAHGLLHTCHTAMDMKCFRLQDRCLQADLFLLVTLYAEYYLHKVSAIFTLFYLFFLKNC